jgi:hypothetical protein
MKTLDNTTADQAKNQISDLKIWGDGDMFKLICKASSKKEGWMKSTKAMEIPGVGCVVQVTTQQKQESGFFPYPKNEDGSFLLKEGMIYPDPDMSTGEFLPQYAISEAVTFVPGVMIEEIYAPRENEEAEKVCVGRRLVKMEFLALTPKPTE